MDSGKIVAGRVDGTGKSKVLQEVLADLKSTLYNRCRRRLGDFSVLLKVKTLEMLNLFLFLSLEPSKMTIGIFPTSVLLI